MIALSFVAQKDQLEPYKSVVFSRDDEDEFPATVETGLPGQRGSRQAEWTV